MTVDWRIAVRMARGRRWRTGITDSAQQSAEAVAALFAERQRFEAWLATLDAKRAVTPAHVYTKVHADDTARLQRVNEQLGRHRAALQEMETELADRLTSLDIDEAKHKDEMAEAELRSNVGELDPREHREILERTALGLEQVTADRLKVTAELGEPARDARRRRRDRRARDRRRRGDGDAHAARDARDAGQARLETGDAGDDHRRARCVISWSR